ncbi:MAG: hypothetical protein AVDCRST_MAG49-620 [uncultured Thermomicrobiales bacterium]|uniref:Uncharacterized protein n=1 Tax=uncultured Thermomicrobiales bacterium TaxID=1645740 RepID=A0A6J4U5A6_9BACT|nr:MAG: hypothetical protein AVDCRST_MAG49-620 [uncultured Thermomicrobiales bacterium]
MLGAEGCSATAHDGTAVDVIRTADSGTNRQRFLPNPSDRRTDARQVHCQLHSVETGRGMSR